MPIQNYGVLRGGVFARVLATTRDEHYHLLVNRGGHPQRVAINTMSATPPSAVLFYADANYINTITSVISQANLPSGFTPLVSASGGLSLDFVRMGLFPIAALKALPGVSTGNSSDLNDQLDVLVQQAITDPSAVLYAFGQHWLDASGADAVFPEIDPSTGIHDIHMNQGNPRGGFFADNGIYQDGGLIFYFPSGNRWAAVFTAFQSESFKTDDQTGDPV